MNLDSLSRDDFALDLAAHDNRIRANLSRHYCALADRDFFAVDLAVDGAVYARRTLKVDLAADLRTAVEIPAAEDRTWAGGGSAIF